VPSTLVGFDMLTPCWAVIFSNRAPLALEKRRKELLAAVFSYLPVTGDCEQVKRHGARELFTARPMCPRRPCCSRAAR